ncbi:sensor histidine kinase [Flavihumibacter solisilvae]|uniref:sensor histidine kinase n=1 Tax=Flavihumibacter solisilvae TaxID=1349421 RepID=UPI00068E113C|nr:sensor histidine kinase [Flavihumibacter solisilvae]
MKPFRKYAFPALFALLIYATIRVINDTIAEDIFWERPWTLNMIEIGTAIITGHLTIFLLDRLFKYFDSHPPEYTGPRRIAFEISCIVIIEIVVNNITLTPMAAVTDDGLSRGDIAIINIIPLLYALIYYAITRSQHLLRQYIESRVQLEKMSRDRAETELKFLKAQYHPHFLFNALNTVYFQMDDNPAAAKATIEKFAELLRYQLYDQQQTVEIKKEIEYLSTYIDLQKIRTTDRLKLQVSFPANLNGQRVYPLLFMPLVENAFKYVGGDYHMKVELKNNADNIELLVENSINNNAAQHTVGGLGLESLKRRLELLYPATHTLQLEEVNNVYTAKLTINCME